MTEAEFSAIALKLCLTGLVAYMFWIIFKIGRESNAGRFGLFILMIALGAGMIGFVAKGMIHWLLS